MYIEKSDLITRVTPSVRTADITFTHEDGEEVTFLSRDRRSAILRTATLAMGQLGVKGEEETLLSSFRTSFHPLTLRHQLDGFVCLRNERDFRIFIDFDDFFATVLREEYACDCQMCNDRHSFQYVTCVRVGCICLPTIGRFGIVIRVVVRIILPLCRWSVYWTCIK